MSSPRWRALFASLVAVLPVFAVTVLSTVAQSAGASSAEDAVRALVSPLSDPSAGGGACDTVRGNLSGCPVTPRLLDRLQHPTPAENGNLVSRSQNPPLAVDIKQLDNDGTTAHVETQWRYGAGLYSITFVVLNQKGGWLVDDSYCTGHPESTIYTAPTGPCAFQVITTGGTNSGGTATPGMPVTGSGNSLVAPVLVISVLTVLAGVVLVFSERRWRAIDHKR